MAVQQDNPRIGLALALGAYFAFMLGLAIMSWSKNRAAEKAAQDTDMSDAEKADITYNMHFMGGKGFPTIALFFTMFSTSYSGYTISGIPAEAAALGFFAFRWVLAYNNWNVLSAIYYPRIRRLSVVRNYLTNVDFMTDRHNNRPLSIMVTIMLCGGQMCYVIAQFSSLKSMIPAYFQVNGVELVNMKVMLWAIAANMYICEILGGFNAVAMTDAVQSVFMIVAMITVPLIATAWWGGAASSVTYDCANFEMLNCNTTLYISRKAACAGKLVPNGCMATVAGWNAVHPSTGFSEFFKPIYLNAAGKPWQSGEPMKDIIKATRGIDGSTYFNHTSCKFYELLITFFGLGFMPNLTARLFAAKTDAAAKKNSIIMVAIGGLIATLPSLLLGIMIKANLSQKYAAGLDTYSIMIAELLNMGGFYELIGAVAGVAAMAAIMSTADSCIISISNMLISEFLMNWLFVRMPGLKKPMTIHVCAKVFSFCSITLALIITLYDSNLNDPEQAGFLLSLIGLFQNTFFLVPGAAMICGMFIKNSSPWSSIIGILSGVAVFVYLFTGPANPDSRLSKMTPFAILEEGGDEDPIKTTYFSATVWASITSIVVNFVLSFLPLGTWIPNPVFMQINTNKHDPEGKQLDKDEIEKVMEGTKEPIFDRLSQVLMVIVLLLVNVVAPPWYGTSYDGCNYFSYFKWLQDKTGIPFGSPLKDADPDCSPDFTGGLPTWTVRVFAVFALSKLLITIIMSRWVTVDSEANTFKAAFVIEPQMDKLKLKVQVADEIQPVVLASTSNVKEEVQPADKWSGQWTNVDEAQI